MRVTQVDPAGFVDQESEPAHGRGAWNRTGIDFDYRYALAPTKEQRIGTRCEESLAHWAVGAGCLAIQRRLAVLGFYEMQSAQRGVFNSRMKNAVKAFQAQNTDPMTGAQLLQDGTVGITDARSLFTPVILKVESKYNIPDKLLLGETVHESALDPGAVGYFIYYPDYRGVDRGMSQINSLANPTVSWMDAFSPTYALDWSGRRLRTIYNQYKSQYPATDDTELWNAAVCSHNNPSAGRAWARDGYPPTTDAAKYVQAVRNAVY